MKRILYFREILSVFALMVILIASLSLAPAKAATLPLVLSNANFEKEFEVNLDGIPLFEAKNMKLGNFVDRVFSGKDIEPGNIKAYVILSGYNADENTVVFVDEDSIFSITDGTFSAYRTTLNSEAYIPFGENYVSFNRIALVFGENDNNITNNDNVYIVRLNLSNFGTVKYTAAVYDGSGNEKIVTGFTADKNFTEGRNFLFPIADDSWSENSIGYVVLGFDGKESEGLTATVYSGFFETADVIPSGAKDITNDVWRGYSKTETKKGLQIKGNEKVPVTIVIKRNGKIVDVVARYIGIASTPTELGDSSLTAKKTGFLYYGFYNCSYSTENSYDIDGYKYPLKIFKLRDDYEQYGSFRLRISSEKGKLKGDGAEFIEKAVLGRYESLEDAKDAVDIKESIFNSADDSTGVDLELEKDYVFTIFLKDGQIIRRAVRLMPYVKQGPKIAAQPQNAIVKGNETATFTVTCTVSGVTYKWLYMPKGATTWSTMPNWNTSQITIPYDPALNECSIKCELTGADGGVTESNTVTLKYALGKSVIVNSANFPDEAFRNYISKNFDQDKDGIIDEETVENVRAIVCYSTGKITSVKGIEFFPNLEELNCYNNKIQFIDLSGNPKLRVLVADENSISTIDLSKCPVLKKLYLSYNKWVQTSGDISYIEFSEKPDGEYEYLSLSLNSTVILDRTGKATIVRQPEDFYCKEGQLAGFVIAVTGKGIKYQWQYKNAGSSTWTDWSGKTNSIISVAYAENRNGMSLRCIVTDSNGNKVISDPAVLRYVSPATIVSQPENVTVDQFESAVFSVRAEGAGLKYLWQYREFGKNNWTDWTTKTTPDISVAYADYRDYMHIRCKVTDALGTVLISDAALLRYNKIFYFTKQPVNNTVEVGSSAAFSVAAKGNGLNYLWQYKEKGKTAWTDWTTKTTAKISVAYADYRNGMQLRCVVTDEKGHKIISDTATLSYTDPLIITKQPVSATANVGSMAGFSVTATGTGLKYLWQYKYANDSAWTDWSTKTTASISVAYAAYRDGMSLRCVVTDASGKKITSDTATLKYNNPLSITKQPENAIVNSGSIASFSVTAKGKGLKYLWQYKNAGDLNWSDWTTKTTASISVAYAAYRDGMSLRCVVTDADGNKVTSNIATLSYLAAFAVTKQPVNATVKSGTIASFSVKATGNELEYRWQYKLAGDSSWTTWSSKTTADITVAYAAYRDGMKLRCVITNVTGAQLTTNVVTLNYTK
ncbi:MAG: hypothetical protein K6E47_00255 [Lachnospiraceae bacterium]|nr:hypothetical protein [Lachnospiraceae bacterium]